MAAQTRDAKADDHASNDTPDRTFAEVLAQVATQRGTVENVKDDTCESEGHAEPAAPLRDEAVHTIVESASSSRDAETVAAAVDTANAAARDAAVAAPGPHRDAVTVVQRDTDAQTLSALDSRGASNDEATSVDPLRDEPTMADPGKRQL